MTRAFVGTVSFMFLVAGVVTACVGDDPATTPGEPQPDPSVPEGHLNGKCTADKKCLEDLECVRGVICLPREDGGTSTTDGGGGGDGSTTDATSSSDDAEAGPVSCTAYSGAPTAGEVTCGTGYCPANSTTKCCMSAQGEPMCQSQCSTKKFACDAPADCAGSVCCLRLNAPITAASACASGVAYSTFNETQCLECINANEYRICSADTDCLGVAGAPKCVQVDVKNADFKKTIGVCL